MVERPKFTMIPKIYAGDLPQEVEDELRGWQEELCYHGSGGCVFSIDSDDILQLPLFKAWMISLGAWTEEQTHMGAFWDFHTQFPEGNYAEYQAWLSPRVDRLSVAMTGT